MTDKKNPFDPAHMTDAMKAQAQQIWLAGLGAFSKAQQDGAKAFEKLVHDGISMQRKAQSTAEEKLAEATQRATQAAQHLNERASGQWDRLEGLFEERVAKALHRMGMPSIHDLQSLQARIDALEAQWHTAPKATAKKATSTRGKPQKTGPASTKKVAKKK